MVAIAAVCGVGIEPENFLMAGPLVAHPLAFLTTLSLYHNTLGWISSTGKVNIMLFLLYFVFKYKLSGFDVLY
jgi:hypothetical protein